MDNNSNYYYYEYNVPVRRRRRRRRRKRNAGSKLLLLVLVVVVIVLATAFCNNDHVDNVDQDMPAILSLPETVEIRSLMLPSGMTVTAQELVTGLEGTGISVSFVKEPAKEVVGLQKVELRFTGEKAECTRTVTLTRFLMNTETSRELESNDIPDIRDYIPNLNITATFKDVSPATIPLESCGRHSLIIVCDGREYPVTYLVTEDIPPKAVGLTVTAEAGSLPDPESLVDQIVDHTEVTVTYAEVPALTVLGSNEVVLLLTDEFGNSSQVKAVVDVIPAKNGPNFSGLEELHVQVGSTISYKSGVSAVDAEDGELTFQVDPGNVDNKKIGTYTAYYTATDSDGHTLTVPRTVVIQDKAEAAVEKYAADVIKKIITDDMTHDQQIYQIYLYTRKNIQFVGTSDKSSIAHAAYEGFTTGKGDCYTYYAINVVLLNMLGIENLEVTRVGGTSHHWWNLVLHQDGKYYHVDSCPKSIYLQGQTYYKMTDSDLDDYTNNKQVAAHRPHYYTYDKTLPEYQDIDIAP